MGTIFLSKSKLAGVLSSTKRTVTNYVNAGVLPPPVRFGRDSGWAADVLTAQLKSEHSPLSQLSKEKRNRLAQAISDLEISLCTGGEGTSELGESVPAEASQWILPEPIIVDDSFNPERDLRRFQIAEVNSYRDRADSVAREAHQAAKGSDIKSELWTQVGKLNWHAEYLEARLAKDFIHLHAPSQFLEIARC